MNRPRASRHVLLVLAAISVWPASGWADEPPAQPTFAVHPVADAAVIAVSSGFAGVLDMLVTTGEIRPQQISPKFDSHQLLSIDRIAVTQQVDPNAPTFANIGLGIAVGYAALDPLLTGIHEGSAKSGLVDGVLFAETLTMTMAVTNLAKVAVRRPRPLAYTAAMQHRNDIGYSNADTDSSLSFFSGHTSVTAAVSATATYLAFARSPRSARPWVTLVAGTALTTFVGLERVRAGKHFPTDVIAGAMVGVGVGLLVPHLHRVDEDKSRAYWLAAAPMNYGKSFDGGVVTLNGVF